jgi:GT2 family glycosyltransferase
MIKVSAIILNWNRANDTLECLDSLQKLIINNFKLKIIVVDNGSTDNSAKKIKKYFTDHQKTNTEYLLIENENNLGFAAGNNIGINHALKENSNYVMLLNNDTIVDKNLVNTMLKYMQENPRTGLVSPKIYFAKGFEFHKKYKKSDLGKIIWYAGGRIDWNNIYGSNVGVDEIDKNQYSAATKTDFATGACVFCRAETLKKIGLFNEKYFAYFEDADLSIRASQAGWNVVYYPDTHLWHKVSQSSGIGSELNDYFITRNRLLFGINYASLRTKLALYKESIRLLIKGRKWQKQGVKDYYLGRFGKGSWR